MSSILHLFQGYGVELEYMIVDKDTLRILPVADKVIYDVAGEYVNEVEFDDMGWSNELALHVIEFKTNGPAKSLNGLDGKFQENVARVNRMLEKLNGMLMPAAMHPFMDPMSEMKIWPHENNPIYESYNRIFDCKGHGWANLQSTHINLPFYDDTEFASLHMAIRLILPLLPAIAASSCVADWKIQPFRDFRVEVYRKNQQKIPSIVGAIIPERVYSRQEYEEKILQKMYNEISPYDTGCILQEEWLNSRGAIARFERNTIEIRLLDVQECSSADLAITSLIVEVIRNLVTERLSDFTLQKEFDENRLYGILMDCVKDGGNAEITDKEYLQALGIKEHVTRAIEVWQILFSLVCGDIPADLHLPLRLIFSKGTLSERILDGLAGNASGENIERVFRQLCSCLGENKMFDPNEASH